MTTKARQAKADYIKGYRRDLHLGYSKYPEKTKDINRLIKLSAAHEHGFPEKPTLANYYPLRQRDAWLITVKQYGDMGDSRTLVALQKGEIDEEDILSSFPEHYGGPGQRYTSAPSWDYNGHSTIVYQSCGWDV